MTTTTVADTGLQYKVCVLDKDHNTVIRAVVNTLALAVIIVANASAGNRVGYASIKGDDYQWSQVY